MKTYYVTFPGIWLEGHMIVNAESEGQALYHAMLRISKDGLGGKTKLSDLTVKEIPNTMGIHQFYNGDY